MKGKFQEPRSQVIVRWTNRMFDETRMRPKEFSMALVDEFQARIDPEDRSVSFHNDGPVEKVTAANLQLMNRFRSRYEANSLRFPCDLEEAWLARMEPEYSRGCRAELARRMGLMAVELPDDSKVTDLQSLSAISREWGESLQALSPIVDNGLIDDADRQHIPKALDEIDQMIAAALSFRARLARQLQESNA